MNDCYYYGSLIQIKILQQRNLSRRKFRAVPNVIALAFIVVATLKNKQKKPWINVLNFIEISQCGLFLVFAVCEMITLIFFNKC